ncbi:MAG: helix-turn-helix transcriptional regulator [Pseudohongiella sp.]|nr:helix-turn-helix transcriptional regulator [Pseudohongiella sp.]MDP2127627.1 helix-turn-helix transcriptional regulator [Pseudohongiella sp.]
MRTPSDVQIIRQGDTPLFAVMPYPQYLELIRSTDGSEATIPHEVVGLCIKQQISLLAAWRIYRGMSQQELAAKIAVTQPAIAQMERRDSRLQKRTLLKLADALAVVPDQLVDGG